MECTSLSPEMSRSLDGDACWLRRPPATLEALEGEGLREEEPCGERRRHSTAGGEICTFKHASTRHHSLALLTRFSQVQELATPLHQEQQKYDISGAAWGEEFLDEVRLLVPALSWCNAILHTRSQLCVII